MHVWNGLGGANVRCTRYASVWLFEVTYSSDVRVNQAEMILQ